ncbi:uncharacterized protein LOC125653851 [Ostrea edulis]|uniref:uncharacterized protein LOC125653851 n=1 Tax=Ostrea edulis TaxID=37623 RepID=UPI0024AFC48D|nr:uncharacterized protein LOC125653851 [Ostrea edulis]
MCSSKEDNFILLIQALRFTNRGLKEYVDICLEDIYHGIIRNVSKVVPTCNTHCNNLPGNQWCGYCKKWKTEIESYIRFSSFKNKLRWQDIDFGKLTGLDRDLAKTELFSVYVKRHPNTPVDFDIQAILSLFQNCVYFDIGKNKTVLDSVRNIRNKHFAHTINFEITKKSLKDSIDKLILLFQHPSMLNHGNSISIITMLKKLGKKNMELVETSTYELIGQVFKLRDDSASAQSKIDRYILPQSTEIGLIRRMRTRVIRSIREQYITVFLILASLIMAYWLKYETDTNMKGYWYSIMTRNSQQEPYYPQGCKTTEYEYPYAVDTDFEFYRSTHGMLVGRKWLLYELENIMRSSPRGVMFIAEMGYGKSAIMSHLACQDDQRQAGYPIYENISVFHICTFESQKTLLPGLFVKNMAGGFAKYIPKFKQYLEQNLRFKDYFEGVKCLEDAEGCLDFLVIKTLHQLKNESKTHIVVIDALDECMEYDDRFNIARLLVRRITTFPKYIKFLISSRNISRISPLKRHLTVFEQKADNDKNNRDIGLFVRDKLQNAQQKEISNLKSLFKSLDVDEIRDKAVKYGKGNMLFVLHALKLWTETDQFSLDKIPNTLESLFYDQFLRIFGNDDAKFGSTRKILEILCASTEPLSEDEIFEIANIPEADQINIIILIGNELSHFIRLVRGKVLILHRSLSKFLTNTERRREQFYISKENGCAHLSYYFLRSVNSNWSFNGIDILQLTEYVSCSKKQELKDLYLKSGKTFYSSIHYRFGFTHPTMFILHRAALKLYSYSSMSLFLDLYLKFPSAHVDENDDGNITASYVAAAYGNHEGLVALLKYGANVNFTRLGPRILNSSFDDMVEFCKLYAQWDYNLLNIASQNGHHNVVRILLRNQVHMKHKISCGLDSFQLASEFGQLSVVKYLLMNHKSAFSDSLKFSLYLASKSGHEDIVSLLLYHGAVDICLPCTGRMYWTKFHQTRLQVIDNVFDLKQFNFIFKDDRRMIRCETAIEVAIQNGYTEVVKRLIAHSNSSLDCRESGGRTPLLTAARFDRTEILEFFMSLNMSFAQHCVSGYQNKDELELSKTEELEYDKNMCLNRMSVFHLVAEYGSSKTLLMLYDNFENAFWTKRDAFGSTPLHYLACQGRVELISHFEHNYHIKSYNGSTLLHSAAICKQYIFLDYLLIRISQSPLDNRKQGVVHYLAQSDSFMHENVQSVIDHNQPSRKTILERIKKEIFFQDAMKRTPLHYAAIHGNINFLLLCFELDWNHTIWNGLFELRDINTLTVLDLLFQNLPPYNSPTSILRRTNSLMINPHQHFISLILDQSFPRNMIEKKLPVFCEYSVRRGYPRILEILLTKYRVYGYDIIHINECKSIFFHAIPTMDYIDQAYFNFLPLLSFLECNCDSLKTFTFHKLMEDRKRSFRMHVKRALNFKMNCSSMDFCYDDEGYNPLHRAVIGGNYDAFEYLINNGMSVNVTSKDGRDVLQLLIEHAPCIPDDFDVREKRSSNLPLSDTESLGLLRSRRYRDIGSYIAKNTTLLMKRTATQICNRKTNSLSIAHVVSATGLLEILEVIKGTFGETYTHCLNDRNISTAYLLSVFGHSSSNFANIDFSIYLMNSTAALYLKYAFDFKPFVLPRDSFYWKCKHRVTNFRNTRSLLSCTGKADEEFAILASQIIKLSGFKSREDFKKYCEFCEDSEMSYDSYFDSILKGLREYWENPKRYKYKYLLLHKKQELLFENWSCKIRRDRKRSTKCLKILSEMILLKRQLHFIFSRISVDILLTNIIHLYDHEIMLPFEILPRNTIADRLGRTYFYRSILLSQIHPGFQLSKEYDYWDVFRRNGDTRSKKMVQTILNTPVSEIRKWKGTERSRLIMLHQFEHSYVRPTDRPLNVYERFQENDN